MKAPYWWTCGRGKLPVTGNFPSQSANNAISVSMPLWSYITYTGLFPGLRPANERRRYFVNLESALCIQTISPQLSFCCALLVRGYFKDVYGFIYPYHEFVYPFYLRLQHWWQLGQFVVVWYRAISIHIILAFVVGPMKQPWRIWANESYYLLGTRNNRSIGFDDYTDLL